MQDIKNGASLRIVMPAKAGIQGQHSSFPRKRESPKYEGDPR